MLDKKKHFFDHLKVGLFHLSEVKYAEPKEIILNYLVCYIHLVFPFLFVHSLTLYVCTTSSIVGILHGQVDRADQSKNEKLIIFSARSKKLNATNIIVMPLESDSATIAHSDSGFSQIYPRL